MTVSSAPSLRRKSGVKTSIVVAGAAVRIARIVRANWPAPPSARSSRSTEVTTTCDRPWLAGIETIGAAGRDIAECAGAGADPAQNHDRGVLLLPALADIRARRLFAHGIELQFAHQPLGGAVFRRARRPDPQPFGLAQNRLIGSMGRLRMARRGIGDLGTGHGERRSAKAILVNSHSNGTGLLGFARNGGRC